MDIVKTWTQQTRAPFLILTAALVFIGAGLAYHDGYHNFFSTVLLLVAMSCAHIAVNLLNELSDHKSKIDHYTKRNIFSGGSGMLLQKKTTPLQVWIVAHIALTIAFCIGVYFTYEDGWIIALLMGTGFVGIYFYTTFFSRWLLGELASGICLGSLAIIGVYYALTTHLSYTLLLVAIPPGILTMVLHLVNEIPDTDADLAGGRWHLVILLGKKNTIYLYIASLIAVYLLIAVIPLITNAPYSELLGLSTMPIAFASVYASVKHLDHDKFQNAQALNVMLVIATDLLLAIGCAL